MSDRTRAVMVLLAVFLLGCVVGGGATFIWRNKVVIANSPRGDAYRRGPQRLVERLQLSSEQEKRFREIMDSSRKQLEAVRAESAPKAAAIRAEMNKEVLAILNDDQKVKFEEFLKEMETRRERARHRPDREGPPRAGG